MSESTQSTQNLFINFTLEETNLVLNILGETAAKLSMPTILKIQQQAEGKFKEEKTVKFEFSTVDVNSIMNSLGEAPARVSMATILNIQKQVQPQLPKPNNEESV